MAERLVFFVVGRSYLSWHAFDKPSVEYSLLYSFSWYWFLFAVWCHHSRSFPRLCTFISSSTALNPPHPTIAASISIVAPGQQFCTNHESVFHFSQSLTCALCQQFYYIYSWAEEKIMQGRTCIQATDIKLRTHRNKQSEIWSLHHTCRKPLRSFSTMALYKYV